MADSRQYFQQVANQWDRMQAGFYSEKVREVACTAADVQPGKWAADIGAGAGFVTEALINHGVRVIAVDQSEAMIEEMRRKFPKDKRIEYRTGQADEHLPISDGAVDYAFANMYLHHVESPPDAIREMVRVVKPGGRIVITDLDEHDHEFLRREHNDRWMGFHRDDIIRWFTSAGLRHVIVDCVGEDCCGASCDGDEMARIRIFVASGEKV